MPLRINCPNCGKQFSAWDDLIGKAVECPKCHQKTVVEGKNSALEQPVSKKEGGPSVPTPPPPPTRAPVRAAPVGAPAVAKSIAAAPGPVKPQVGKPVAPPLAPRAAPIPKSTPIPAPRSKSSPQYDDDDSLPNGCPHCNATMQPNDDLCDHCGYHLVLKKVIDISDMPKRNQSTGFERMFKDQLDDPEATSNTLLWIKIVGSLILVGLLIVFLGRWWWVGVLVAAGIAGYFWMRQRQRIADGESASVVNTDPISQVIWSGLLVVQRILGWRMLQWPFRKARSLILCDPAFQDSELAAMDRLNDLEALDLQGTGITDESLENLRPLKQLRFLVLRKTQVSAAAAQRLQLDLPKTLIWF